MTYKPNDTINGKYRLIESVGEGAMGDVFKAEHLLMRKLVAIKILNEETNENDELVQRFEREALISSSIKHPNVCVVTDFATTEKGNFFLVMEYLEGDTLAKRIRENGKLSPSVAVDIMTQLLGVLQCIHEKGVVHRDIKPENIQLIEQDGKENFVKLIDFGIAHLGQGLFSDDDSTLQTQLGTVYGTPEYISPEQVAGRTIDHRADLYACGVVLYEMLTGKPPFTSDSFMNIMQMHYMMDPPHLDIDAIPYGFAFDAIIQKLMKKSPEERYQSASEVSNALNDVLRQTQSGKVIRDDAAQIVTGTRQLATDIFTKTVNVLKNNLQRVRLAPITTKVSGFVSKFPKWCCITFIVLVALLILTIILAITLNKDENLLSEEQERAYFEKNQFLFDYKSSAFDLSLDDSSKPAILWVEAANLYKIKEYELAFSKVLSQESVYEKNPNYWRIRMMLDHVFLSSLKPNDEKEVLEKDYIDDLITSFAKLVSMVPDAARNKCVSDALRYVFPNIKSGVSVDVRNRFTALASKQLAVGMAWAIIYTPFFQEQRVKAMFSVLDDMPNSDLPEWQIKVLSAWRLKKENCEARKNFYNELLELDVDNKTLYYGWFLPLQTSSLSTSNCKNPNFPMFTSDCNECMRKIISKGYNQLSEFEENGDFENAEIDFDELELSKRNAGKKSKHKNKHKKKNKHKDD